MSSRFKITKDNSKNISDALRYLAKTKVMVGIPATAAARKDGAAFNNAAIGFVQENGAPEINLPARPHLKPGVDGSKDQWLPRLKDAGTCAFDGNKEGAIKNQHAAGMLAAQAVKKIIQDVIPPPLSERTLAARRARGRTGETPLFDTGEYSRHITHVIREEK